MIRWKNQSSSTNEKKKLHERKSLFSIAFLTSTFTVCQYSIQNVLGRCFKFHSGHFGPALFFIALVSNSGSLFLSNSLNSFAHDILEQNLSKEILSSAFFKDLIPSPHGYTYKPEGTMEVPISRIYAGLAANFLLEKGNFRTIVPSTIVGLGSYAVGKYLNSLPTDKAAATQNQRIAIQRIGRRCGCHHCGSRLSRTFIADHMPPTKFVEEWKRKWYNKLFKRKIQQRLWPQCERCFHQQGHAVRTGSQVLIYHMKPRLALLAPALALFLVGSEEDGEGGPLTECMGRISRPTAHFLKQILE